MPRLNNGLEVLKGISKIEAFSPLATTPFDQNTTVAIVAQDSTFTVAATTNATAGDPILISGDGGSELNEIKATVNVVMPVKWKLLTAQSIGARALEMVARTLGHVDTGGVKIDNSLQLIDVDAATSAVAIAQIRGAGALKASFNLRGWNTQNWLFAHGSDESETGVGSAADPYQSLINGFIIGTHGTLALRVTGSRVDLKTVTWDFCGVTMEVKVSTSLGAKEPATLPVAFSYTSLIQRIWT